MPRKSSVAVRKESHDVRETAGDHPPPLARPVPPGTTRQSPLPEHVEVQAQKLIHETGSPNAAKTAVDVAAEREHIPDFQEDNFALRWGFSSRAALRAASKPLTAPDNSLWWATHVDSDRWIVWNKENMAASEKFESLDEARCSLDKCEH